MHIQQMPDTRPTIGLLCNELNSELISQMVWSAADAAQRAGANLLCFAGGALRDAQGRPLQSTVLYDLVGQHNVDGLLVLSNFMGTFVSRDEMISRVFDPYQPLPTISIGLTVGAYPAILVDNYSGMYAAVTHLIETHGYQHVAFVRGPHKHDEANIRFQAYQDALAHHGLPLDPALVVTGDFLPLSGEAAIATLLDERHMSCQAIVAANDLMAFGVLKALQERQVHVPHDIAVVGFDDTDSSRYTLPPLTTVRQPIHEIGQRTVNLMLSMLAGEETPQRIDLPTELVVRQSCGCINPAVAQAMIGLPKLTGQCHNKIDLLHRQMILEDMKRALGQDVQPHEQVWLDQLLDTFLVDLDAGKQGSILAILDEIFRQANDAGRSPAAWGNALVALRRSLFPLLPENQIVLAEDSWLPAQTMIYEMLQQRQYHYAAQLGEQMRRMTDLQGTLITAFDLQQVADILVHELPRLGIPSCSISLYENPQFPGATSRLLLAYKEKFKRFAPPEEQQVFVSKQLAPAGYFPDYPYCIVIEALHFGAENLGLALFEVGIRQGNIYESVRGNISSALQAARLIQRVQERSAELARQQYILDTFMENIPDHIYFKDLQSRITRANKAHAINLSLSDPAEEIGKSDLDFFPGEQARVTYEQEQAIIRTGQPILNLEEIDRFGHWVLTTKMPLRNEHGHIIGTFGISRDITELKQTQAALQQAYAEVEQQVQERTTKLQHEISERKRAEAERERLIADLEAKNAELERFTYTVSHDLKAPLITIRGFLGLLEKDALAGNIAQLRADMARIVKATNKMQRLLNELLELSRVGRLVNTAGAVPFEIIAREAINLAWGQLDERQVHVELADDLPQVYGDYVRLVEVMQNLVDNAAKFMGDQPEPRITIGHSGIDRDEKLILFVRDNGMGIDPQYHEKVFGLFDKIDPQTEGTGIGLALVKRIVEVHGGRIWVESEGEGQGTAFFFTLPGTPE